ncbi:MAG TPA: Ig-like domain-containing protein, partial [Longimicrobiaceae bacterium]|nr:Ig-like domain-containing protein [Longimicrobiaceae bacterium]
MIRLLIALAALVLLLAACDGDPTRPAPVASVQVAPDERTIAVGEVLPLQAVLRDTKNRVPQSVTVTWSTDNPAVATVSEGGLVVGVAPGTATITATAEEKSGSVQVRVAAAPPECTTPGAVRSLAVGEAVTLGGVLASVVCLDGGVAGKDYLAVPWNGSGTAAATVQVSAGATGVVPVAPGSPSLAPDGLLRGGRPLRRDEAFELGLRRKARELTPYLRAARALHATRVAPAGMRAQSAPSVGTRVRLNVQTNSNCDNADVRTGRVVAVSQRAVIVADSANPAGGLTPAEYGSIAASFDTLVYPVDVENFGEPEDVDDNGRVLIFYTRAVNELTPPGSGSFIAGYFFSRDLFPKRDRDNLQACEGSNYAEMFYMLVPDPAGTVNNNPRPRALILQTTVGT